MLGAVTLLLEAGALLDEVGAALLRQVPETLLLLDGEAADEVGALLRQVPETLLLLDGDAADEVGALLLW